MVEEQGVDISWEFSGHGSTSYAIYTIKGTLQDAIEVYHNLNDCRVNGHASKARCMNFEPHNLDTRKIPR